MSYTTISTLIRQCLVLILVVAVLSWDSMPVPDPDGRYACDIYEFPSSYDERYKAISIYQQPDWNDVIVKAPIIKATWNEPNATLNYLLRFAPFIERLLPGNILPNGGWVIKVTVTQEEWNRLRMARQRKLEHLTRRYDW